VSKLQIPDGFLKRRALAIAVVVGVLIGAIFSIAAGDDEGDGYLVRAIFDNGGFVIPGEDVKIAGVKVGAIHDVDLTERYKAAVVLKIDDPAFQSFREDAYCQIRLQSLIGEQFIACQPTRPHKDGAPLPPELAQIPDGEPGEGQHLLPVQNNVTPVGIDLIQNIQRLPQREGLRLIFNELGAGLAGNGDRLRAAVRRANPALRETDRVIKILASQDKQLGRLVDESDRVLASWVDKRKNTSRFIDQSGALAAASAERGDDIERNFERLPGLLRELKPTLAAFGGFADQASPALESLGSQSAAINESFKRLGPFSEAATPALVSLGDFADQGRKLFPEIRPLVGQLNDLGEPLRPSADDLAKLFNSLDDTGGVEELMKLIYFYTGTVNGVDAKGHYVRATITTNGPCSSRTYSPSNCASSMTDFGSSVKASATMEPALDYLLGSEETQP
jgi:ABC-type transporter Mla subunit MlaD